MDIKHEAKLRLTELNLEIKNVTRLSNQLKELIEDVTNDDVCLEEADTHLSVTTDMLERKLKKIKKAYSDYSMLKIGQIKIDEGAEKDQVETVIKALGIKPSSMRGVAQ